MLVNYGPDDGTISPSHEKPIFKLIILSGRSGSGKSSTAYEICHTLRCHQIPHTHIDGDNLDASYPADDTSDMMLLNLESMWGNYYLKVHEIWRQDDNAKPFVVILSGTGMILQLDAIVAVFTRVLGGRLSDQEDLDNRVDFQVSPIVLGAGDDVVESRLKVREIGGELDAHLQSSYKMSRILGGLNDDRIKSFRTDTAAVTEIAAKILQSANIRIR